MENLRKLNLMFDSLFLLRYVKHNAISLDYVTPKAANVFLLPGQS